MVELPMTNDTDNQQKINRLEVIDESGRAYVKGPMYGTPVSVELSYQDGGRTLKVFVKEVLSTPPESQEETS